MPLIACLALRALSEQTAGKQPHQSQQFHNLMSANTFPNPKGQIRRKPVRDALDAILARPGDDALSDKPATIAQRTALSLVSDALKGDKKAREELIDRTDGKAAQAIEHSGMIASTHEELLKQLDNGLDDADGEGDTETS
jgi:hypothetical protein